jgi:signal transduction histidine kinase
MQASVMRMSGLITNVLDFARGRLGGGLTLEPVAARPEAMLALVVAELQSTSNQIIESDFSGLGEVVCDPGRIGQMLSNLIGNAITHGAPGMPIKVKATSNDDVFELTVANQGEPIPPAIIAHLFQPFFRASTRPNQQGLGLGLYIASEIAHAHGGTLTADSVDGETRFVFRTPIKN